MVELPSQMRPPVRFAFEPGWRFHSGVTALTWDRVDLGEGTVRLEPGSTKTGGASTVYVTSAVFEVLVAQMKVRKDGVPWVFPAAGGVRRITKDSATRLWS